LTHKREFGRTESLAAHLARIPAALRLAFTSFLAVPTGMVGGFLLVAIVTYLLDRRQAGWLAPLRSLLQAHVFGSPEATAQLLATVAAGMITLTSITFSLLLVALQQSAGSMTHAVFDQFLRRRLNQAYAGWFIGLTLFTLVTLATVAPPFNPILGAMLSLILAISGLYVLLLLIYAAIEQMRPEAILESIHDHALAARQRQQGLLARTQRHAQVAGEPQRVVLTGTDGYVTGIDLDTLEGGLASAAGAEIVLRLPIGGYVAFQDPIADIHNAPPDHVDKLAEAVKQAVHIDRARDLDQDPAFALEQIEAIGWTSISTSKQDPGPGLEAVRNLRDLLARWIGPADNPGTDDGERLAVVYPDDLQEQLMESFASLAAVTTESMQHQVYAEILFGFATMLDRLPETTTRRIEEMVLRSLSGLGDLMLTAELDRALAAMIAAFERADLTRGATEVRIARNEMARALGNLNSRSTRVPRQAP
jgi:uncharacterized membrane protein